MNIVLTKRDDEEVKLHYGNHSFFCQKAGKHIYLKAADQNTAIQLDCEVGNYTGCIREVGVKTIKIEFRDKSTVYAATCIFTYQTSCMPWIAAILYPNKNML